MNEYGKINVSSNKKLIRAMSLACLKYELYSPTGAAKVCFERPDIQPIYIMAYLPKIGWSAILAVCHRRWNDTIKEIEYYDPEKFLGTYVHPDYRRQGIGSRLVKSVLRFNKQTYNLQFQCGRSKDAELFYKECVF